MPAFGLQTPGGFDYVAMSDLPTGAGLSSSAAIELASGLAFLSLTGQDVDRETLVKIGKHAENNFVGVPCGILDQGVSGFGKAGRLVFIDCRGPRFDTVPMPEGAHFWIFNTHTKHALVDGLYAARHRECRGAATEHVYGARLTGGGFGGAVMALTDASFGESQAQAVAAAYEKKYGAKPDVLHMLTGDGAQVL